MDYIFEVIANLIIEGAMSFAKVVKQFKAGVSKKLKEKGHEELATDSNAMYENK